MADAFLRLKDVPAALDILKEATEQWPDDARVKTRIAGAHMVAQDNRQALADLESALAADPDNTDALFLAIYLLNRPAAAGESAGNAQTPALLARFSKAYIDARGPHRTVVEQWMESPALSKPKP
jgi:tetratricopeptide (TPR) repeat protein